jgi:photosystem II stability/assembly factor-like uncharacterized protein
MNDRVANRTGAVAGVAAVMALLVGGATALLMSDPASIVARSSGSGSPGQVGTLPTPSGSLKLGTLSAGAGLTAIGTDLFAVDAKGAWQSTNSAATWAAAKLPPGGVGLVVDRSDAMHRLAGGGALMQTTDGGATWTAPKAQPPGAAPFNPLLISPTDKTVWFVAGNGHLLRTRDAGATWAAVTGLPTVNTARMAALSHAAEFLLGVGGQVFELLGNGTQVKALPSLPSGGVAELAVIGTTDPPPALAVSDTGHAYVLRSGAWSEVPGGLAGPIDGVTAGHAWVGDGGRKLGAPARMNVTLDGGTSWKPATGLPADQSIEAIAAAGSGGGSVWALTAGGELYQATDGGLIWALVSHAFSSA